MTRFAIYNPVSVPGDHLHFVCKRRTSREWDQEHREGWAVRGGRAYTLLRIEEHDEFNTRKDYGPYCLIDMTAQPDDDHPLLVAKALTEASALRHVRKHYKEHVEASAGLEYDNLHMVEDLAEIQQTIAAEVVALAKLGSRPQVERRLGPTLTRIKGVQNTADRRLAMKLILELLIDQVTGFEETTETLQHLLVRRARVLIEYLRVQSLKAAFEAVRVARNEPSLNIDRLNQQYPDDVMNQHRKKFQEMLRQWQVYIRRDDFERITKLRTKSWHWTDAALAQHVREFAAADAAAESD